MLHRLWRRHGANGGTKRPLSASLSDSESEAAETQVWLQFAVKCEYIDRDAAAEIYQTYDEVLGMLVAMINHPEPWLLVRGTTRRK